MIKEAIYKLQNRENLTEEEARQVLDEIMSGKCSEILIASYLTALSQKGETIPEIVGSARGMRDHAAHLAHEGEVLEIVGTGGDHSNSFNISTTASLVAASAGIPVAKHGNRAASSKSGAADCLEALGVEIAKDPQQCREILDSCGICFLFAPMFHSAMKYAAPVRKELGIRTIFNLLGPLTNPADASLQVMGVYDESQVEPMAHVLSELGVRKGMVVYGLDGLDEISLSSPTRICEFENSEFETYTIEPETFGYASCSKEDLLGGLPEDNARITLDILTGKDNGPKKQAVCLNAGAGLYVAGKADTFAEGIRKAEYLIDSGAAARTLEQFRTASHA